MNLKTLSKVLTVTLLLSTAHFSAHAGNKLLDCPSDKVHAPEVRLLYLQKIQENGTVGYFFKPKEPLQNSQTWEPMCKRPGRTDYSEMDLHVCEMKLYKSSFLGFKKELMSHFIYKYDFVNALEEVITIKTVGNEKPPGTREVTRCILRLL